MKTFIFLLAGIVALHPVGLQAVPSPPHLARGVVQSIDLKKRILSIVPTDQNRPTVFIVKEGPTRLRSNGKPADLVQLSAGQTVRVYYKKELGEWIATEVSWKAKPPPPARVSDAIRGRKPWMGHNEG